LMEINPPTDFVSQKITKKFSVGSDAPRNHNDFRFYKK
jgi:hypothetical protein